MEVPVDPAPSDSLSSLSASTCEEEFEKFAPLPCTGYKVFFAVSNDEYGTLRGQFRNGSSLMFLMPLVDIIIAPARKSEDGSMVTIFGEAKDPDLEWKYVMQVRLRTGTGDSKVDRVVDGDVFEFGKRARPILLRIGDDRITRVHIETRFIQKVHDFLPKFDEGDVVLLFGKTMLKVHKALLALHSEYMAENLQHIAENGVVNMGDGCLEGFKEILYQIYPTSRPIWADFLALAKAANQYRVSGILEKMVTHLVNYEHMYLEQKIKEAIKLELPTAIEELVYKAEQNGYWSQMIRNGLNPELEYGTIVYRKLILPAIAKAKLAEYGAPLKEGLFRNTDFRDLKRADDPFNVKLVVQGVALYVNAGILAVHNDQRFARGNRGELIVQVSVELMKECYEARKTPLDVVEAMMRHIHPQNEPIPINLVRPMLVVAKMHEMPFILRSLEQCLIEEPPSSPKHFLEHFHLAEKYELQNLLLMSLHRIEKSCKHFAMPMTQMSTFMDLSEETRSSILDRYCSGWAVGRVMPTNCLRRVVKANGGGEAESVFEQDKDLSTFADIDSQEAFGDPEELVYQ